MRKRAFFRSGFTLIEVVITLAIAGLIFIVVFLAVSQAQQARRNQQRKNDASRFLAGLEQFASNNGGEYPGEGLSQWHRRAAADYIIENYLHGGTAANPTGEFSDPITGSVYEVSYGDSIEGDIGTIDWYSGVRCVGSSWLPLSSGSRTLNPRDVSVVITLEPGGVFYCIDNK